MAAKSHLSIRAAVMNCFARCADSPAPLSSLGDFLEKLSALGWSPSEVHTVEMSVLRLLGLLKDQGLERQAAHVAAETLKHS